MGRPILDTQAYIGHTVKLGVMAIHPIYQLLLFDVSYHFEIKKQ